MITASAGDAIAHNKVIHVTDPWPRAAHNTHIAGNGARVDKVTKRYLSGSSGNSGKAGAASITISPSSNSDSQ
jgi:hypothetical protein